MRLAEQSSKAVQGIQESIGQKKKHVRMGGEEGGCGRGAAPGPGVVSDDQRQLGWCESRHEAGCRRSNRLVLPAQPEP